MVNKETAVGTPGSNDINFRAALEIRNISQSYSQGNEVLDILRGVNLKIMPGEMVGLVGQSGSGKSTLLHLAGLLEKPSSGTIFLHGVDCGELSDLERTRYRATYIGFIYQFHHLLPEFTATENVMHSFYVELPYILFGSHPPASGHLRISMIRHIHSLV